VPDRYYPESLLRVYFNVCRVQKREPDFSDMQQFVFEALGNGHSDGIPTSKLNEVFKNARKNQHSRTR
jgi:hypothetical protein